MRTSAKAVATRAALIELAAQLFSTRGYLQTSIRDIARDADLTTGAIYGHFRNKADLLAEAISSRTATDLEATTLFGDGTIRHVDSLRRISARYAERRELRALILQGAAAALTDDETRERLRDEQLAHLDDWAARYQEHREALGIDPSVDVRDALLYTWAAEVGLGVLEALGIEPRSKKSWGDMAARFGRGMTLPPEAPAPSSRAGKRPTLVTGGACQGRVALVTGASQGGTGTAIAVRLAAEGAIVAITARTVSGLEATRERIEAVGGRCLVLPVDLASPDGGRRDLVAHVEAELGPLDILVNNAAVNGYRPFDEVRADDLERNLQVNLWAPWELMKAAVPGMRERGRGWVVNLTSFSAELPPGPPFPTNKPATGGFQYGASKAALNRLTVAAASETHGQGIAVNALTPQAAIATPALVEAGWIKGPMFEPLETMAEAALALCSGDPDVLTGRIAFSLQLLVELDRPVRDLRGEALVDGWQPADLPAVVAGQEADLAGSGWPDAYTFGRGHSPRP